ncbi:MAG: HYR domain-containing protein, partial [Verrucomicrobia bacterium]|nr:HYR domain-containing protein [Verrucomicrobiota bacterium]
MRNSNHLPGNRSSLVRTLLLALAPVLLLHLFTTPADTATSTQIQSVAPLAVPRRDHTATQLADGRVLIAGGLDASNAALASAELYDPAAQTFSSVGALVVARTGHTATLLGDGRVLITGGLNGNGAQTSIEIYDPATQTFAPLGFMQVARADHTASVLADGRVLLAGGDSAGSAELLDVSSGTSVALPNPMSFPRSGQTATLFSNNTVFLAAGGDNTAEVFDPASLDFGNTRYGLLVARGAHTAIVGLDSKIYLVGGGAPEVVSVDPNNIMTPSLVLTLNSPQSTAVALANGKSLVLWPGDAGIFTPGANIFTSIPGSGVLQRSGATATSLAADNQRVLVAGGADASSQLIAPAALFNPATISTDADDYPPGANANITAAGFLPGETVEFIVLHADGTPSTGAEHLPWQVAADANGNVQTAWFVCTDDCVGALLEVTAQGLASGLKAQARFTDAASLTISNNAVSAANVCAGSTSVPLHSFGLAGSGNPSTTVSGVSFTTTGTYAAADLVNFRLYFTTTATFSTVNLLATISPTAAGLQTFTGLSDAFSGNGTHYYWLVMNVASSVVGGHTIAVNGTTTANITTSSGTAPSGGPSTVSGTQTLLAPGTWLGTTSTDWNTAANWCGGVPTSTTDVIIPSTAPNQPTIGAAGGTCRNLTINSGATLTISGSASLSVAGNWSNSGTFTPATGTVTLAGAGSLTQTISGTTTFNNLTINDSGATKSFGTSSITIANNLTVTAGTMSAGTSSFVFSGSGNLAGGVGKNFYDIQINNTVTTTLSSGNVTVAHNFVNNGTYTFSGVTTKTTTFNGTTALTGTGSFNFSSLTISGTLTSISGTINVAGDWTNNGTFTHNSGTVNLNGSSSAQALTGATIFNNLTLNNGNGANLFNDETVNGTLTFTTGKITTGANNLIIGSGGAVSGAGTGKYIFGNERKVFLAGTPSFTFEVGDSTTYAQIDLAFASVTTGGNITAKTTSGDHTSIATSGINSAKDVNRYWTMSNSGVVFTTYSATFHFVAGDLDAGADTTAFIVRRFNSPNWSSTTTGTRTTTSTQANGVASFSDFAVGEPCPLILPGCPANISQANDANQCNASVSFAATPSGGCGSLTATYAVGGTPITSPHTFPVGTTTVDVTVTDPAGDSAICSFTVTVNDTQAPSITCGSVAAQAANADASCNATVPDVRSLVRAQSSDNCTANVSLTVTQSPAQGGTVNGAGSHPITVTVTDTSNNSTPCVVSFTVNDVTAPVIGVPGANATISCPATPTFTPPSATDNCDLNPSIIQVSDVTTPGSCAGAYSRTITWKAKDASGNSSGTVSQTITVHDTTAPV